MSQKEKDVWMAVEDEGFGLSPFAVRVYRDDEVIKTVRIEPDLTYIGRMPENHIVLDDPRVSRSHACIRKVGEDYIIEDQQSENGILIHGKKAERARLVPGMQIMVGIHLLEVIMADETMSAKPESRESHMDHAEEEQWRLDMTMSGVTEDMRKAIMAKIEKKRELDLQKKQPVRAPKFAFSLKVGDQEISKQFHFEKGKRRPEKDQKPNEMSVRIVYGPWILEKKISL